MNRKSRPRLKPARAFCRSLQHSRMSRAFSGRPANSKARMPGCRDHRPGRSVGQVPSESSTWCSTPKTTTATVVAATNNHRRARASKTCKGCRMPLIIPRGVPAPTLDLAHSSRTSRLPAAALQNVVQLGVFDHGHNLDVHQVAPHQGEFGEGAGVVAFEQVVAAAEAGGRPAAEESCSFRRHSAGLLE